MTRVWLVRHGQANAHWWQDADPHLSAQGRNEAATAVTLLNDVGPMPVVSSPLARTRQTAEAFARAWGVEVMEEVAVSEVPSPVPDLAGRQDWLYDFLASSWSTQSDELWRWRRALIGFVGAVTEPTVVVTHAVAINTVLSEANNDDRVFTEAVAPGSVTVVDVEPAGASALTVVAVGALDNRARVW